MQPNNLLLTHPELFKIKPEDILVTSTSIIKYRKIVKKSTNIYETTVERISRKHETARTRAQDTTEAFRLLVLEAMGNEALAADYPLHPPAIVAFLNKNPGNMICTNHYANIIRKKAYLFKFALEQNDYNFIIDVLVKGRCARDADARLKRVFEEVDGKQEDTLGFIEHLQNDPTWGGHYRVPYVNRIKSYLIRCQKEDAKYF